MIKKVISGGQDGADIAGLRAAHSLGIETGGAMPKGFKTVSGRRPEYARIYKCHALESSAYPPRTLWNVANSDCTIIFANDFTSTGTVLTQRACRQLEKPYKPVSVGDMGMVTPMVNWLVAHQYEIVNVAGNRDPAIEKFVESFMRSLITHVNKRTSRRVN